jgi:hypothetical protein
VPLIDDVIPKFDISSCINPLFMGMARKMNCFDHVWAFERKRYRGLLLVLLLGRVIF